MEVITAYCYRYNAHVDMLCGKTKLKVRGSACRWYRVSAVGPTEIAGDRNSEKCAVSVCVRAVVL